MRLVSPLLKHVVYPGLSKAGYIRRLAGTELAVLTYHGVLPAGYKIIDPSLDGNLVSADSFRHQLRFLKNQYNLISPEQFRLWCEAGHPLPARSVLLTCDDGLQNCLSGMLPILQEFEIECLFFVTGATLSHTPTMLWYEELYLMFMAAPDTFILELPEIGVRVNLRQQRKQFFLRELVRKFSQYDLTRRKTLLRRVAMQLGLAGSWDAAYREDRVLRRRFLVLNRAELHQLAGAGMCIGAHTVSHPVLSQSSPDMAWNEVSESKHSLDQFLGQDTWALAYPFGDSTSVTSRELEMAERAGFKAAFLNESGSLGTQTPRFALPRVHITAAMSLAELESHISGLHRSLRELFRPGNHSASVRTNA